MTRQAAGHFNSRCDMVRGCALLVSLLVIGALAPAAPATRAAGDPVDDFRALLKAGDVKTDALSKSLQGLIEAGTAAALPPVTEALDQFEQQLESSSVSVARG